MWKVEDGLLWQELIQDLYLLVERIPITFTVGGIEEHRLSPVGRQVLKVTAHSRQEPLKRFNVQTPRTLRRRGEMRLHAVHQRPFRIKSLLRRVIAVLRAVEDGIGQAPKA